MDGGSLECCCEMFHLGGDQGRVSGGVARHGGAGGRSEQ